MSTRLVPVNYSAPWVVSQTVKPVSEGGTGQPAQPPVPPAVDQLANWAVEQYSLDVSAAADLGFPVGSLNIAYKQQVLLFGSSRSADVQGEDGNIYRFGVALRALIEVSNLEVDGAITVPLVAARVELGQARASAQLMVRGYKGSGLGSMLPQWQTFGVDSYAAYMKAVSEIQSKIMADEQNIVPELLATTALPPSLPPPTTAVAEFYALDAIASQRNLKQALDGLGEDEKGQLGEIVRAVYGSRGLDGKQPDRQTADQARSELLNRRLAHGIFSG